MEQVGQTTPSPCWPVPLVAAQDAVRLWGCKRTLLACVQPFVHQGPQILLRRDGLSEFFSQPVHISGIAPTHVQHLAFGLVESHQVHVCSISNLFRSLWMTSLPSVVSVAPLSLVSPSDLLRVHSIPLSISLIKMMKFTNPKTNLWEHHSPQAST